MRLKFIFLTLTALLLFSASLLASPPPAKKYKLRLNLKQGDTFQVFSQIDQDIKQMVMGQAQNISQHIGIGYQFDVLEAKANIYSVKVTYTRTTFNSEGATGNINFDSDNGTEDVPPMAVGYAAMVGESFKMVIDNQGEVKIVKGLDGIIEKMIERLNVIAPGGGASVAEQLKSQYGDENMISTMQQLMAIYPTKKVKMGDEWEKSYTINSGMTLQLNHTYKLEEINGNEAKLAVTSKISSDPRNPLEMGGMSIFYEVAGTQKGTVTLNIENGWTSGSVMNQDLSGEVTTKGDMLPQDMTWPIEISTASVVKSK